ncbi:hypothetical protein Avbf_11312 [Armadillidium vulgare]|nr:hypothetical protein Avbf_11312 [Armadillidium vulgare]
MNLSEKKKWRIDERLGNVFYFEESQIYDQRNYYFVPLLNENLFQFSERFLIITFELIAHSCFNQPYLNPKDESLSQEDIKDGTNRRV